MPLAPVLFAYLFVLVSRAVGGCPDVDFTAFDTAPAMVDSTTTIVDRELVNAGVEGKFFVEVFVLPDGSVCEAHAQGASWNPKVEAVLESEAQHRRFVPATRDGRPVPGVATVAFDLEMRVVREAPPIVDTNGPMVSEAADDSRRGRCGVEAFRYDDVWIYGDLSIRDFETIRGLVAEFVDADARIRRVDHHLAYPSECRSGPEFLGDRPDVGVEVVWRGNGKSDRSGSSTTYYFVNDGGDYQPFPIASTKTACPVVRSEDDN